jgi:hypothetical protein
MALPVFQKAMKMVRMSSALFIRDFFTYPLEKLLASHVSLIYVFLTSKRLIMKSASRDVKVRDEMR